MSGTENESQNQISKIGDLKVQVENIAFNGDEMIVCKKCGKSNPPNRAGCLYCGTAIESPAGNGAELRLNFRRLENWENGFNVVFVPPANNADAASAARYLKIEAEICEQMMTASDPFPLARLESESEASLAVGQLSRYGINASIVSDVNLKIGKPCPRLRSVEFLDNTVRFTVFNTSEQVDIANENIVLIVVGRIVESKMESVEKGRKEKRKLLSETATSSDEVLIDIYAAGAENGWRMTTKGFDFSTLGSEKSMLAAENIRLLRERLRSCAVNAKVVEEYPKLIQPLSEIWDIERRTDFDGVKRTGMWKSGFASVTRTSNLEQFSKYSRLQRLSV